MKSTYHKVWSCKNLEKQSYKGIRLASLTIIRQIHQARYLTAIISAAFSSAPERVERYLLQDFLERLFLGPGIEDRVAREALAQQVDHARKSRCSASMKAIMRRCW